MVDWNIISSVMIFEHGTTDRLDLSWRMKKFTFITYDVSILVGYFDVLLSVVLALHRRHRLIELVSILLKCGIHLICSGAEVRSGRLSRLFIKLTLHLSFVKVLPEFLKQLLLNYFKNN